MDDLDLRIRNATYGSFVDLGRAPTPDEIAALVDAPADTVRASWDRLHAGHAIVLDGTGGIRMLNPFSAVPTPFVVEAAGRDWYANCGWDAFGIGAALHVDSTIRTTCGDCGAPIEIRVRDGRPDPQDLVWHVLVPAASWWDDIGFT